MAGRSKPCVLQMLVALGGATILAVVAVLSVVRSGGTTSIALIVGFVWAAPTILALERRHTRLWILFIPVYIAYASWWSLSKEIAAGDDGLYIFSYVVGGPVVAGKSIAISAAMLAAKDGVVHLWRRRRSGSA